MATPRPTSLLRTARTAVVALVVAGLLPVGGALAAPGSSSADARRELEALSTAVDAAVEEYAQVRIDLAAAQRKEASARARVGRVEAQLRTVQSGLGSVIRSAYATGGQDDLVALMTSSDPQAFLDGATTMERVARGRKEQLRSLRVLHRRLDSERRAARSVLDARRGLEKRMATRRAQIERQVARQEALVGRLESAESRARRAEAGRRQARASRERVTRYSGPASGRAAIAVNEAYRQLGKPYRWGASGPDRFDCSGLTMWVWGKAGVSLPHSSRAQFSHGVRVSKSDLRPGDLVFYGSPIHHVGIYVGSGQYIAAPQTGDVVGFRSVNRGGWAGAVRL